MISLSGKQWIFKSADELKILALQQKFGLSDSLARILAGRHVSLEAIPSFLTPKIQDLMPDPSRLLDIDTAVQRVQKAIHNAEKIVVYGDYDVDGATSVALLVRYFRALGVPVETYIPDRLAEGYGVNLAALETLHKKGAQLVLMVDCGTTAVAEIEAARAWGLDAIILDHHAAGVALPPAVAVINPHRVDQPPVLHTPQLCAAGVVFLFLVALQRALKKAHFFSQENPPPDLIDYCDFVALGTVCDVMPLQGLNRAFVRRGLILMSKRQNLGLAALMKVAGIQSAVSAYHLGFALGPRINADGRIGSSQLGLQLLTEQDDLAAKDLAEQLHELNDKRQKMEKKLLEEALQQIEQNQLQKRPVLLVGAEEWHPGLVGIAASRLKDQFQKPCFVASFDGAWAKGSARSLEGLDLGVLIHEAVSVGILEKGGGHALAGGFTLARAQWDAFYEFLTQKTQKFMETFQPVLEIDAELSLSGATLDLLRDLSQLEPFGTGNPLPRFCFHRARPAFVRPIGSGHLQCTLEDEAGNTLAAVAFRCQNTKMGEALLKKDYLSLVGHLQINEWRDQKSPQFIIEDGAWNREI
ncbi:single-stranded-DNA-specific exonuclease RecJ [Alphaproteobacteria bacterium]|nr:single-stranded-DNA-specific exonuclease RecJ [Alphaproteobacteria bacterium]GHS95758.1 single-stranded-DNA-specific exonuclease RecJ [Alphaproteobacteria bacterium]